MVKGVLSVCLAALAFCFAPPAHATPSDKGGKAVAYAMPLAAVGIAVWKDDWTGAKQLTAVTVLTVGTAYALKHLVRECRPFARPCSHDSNDWNSFPSTTSALASAPSQFIWHRYGWEWGLPFFVISKYTSYSLDRAKKNRLWDGVGSMAISFAYNSFITTRYHPSHSFYTSLDAGPDGIFASVNYSW